MEEKPAEQPTNGRPFKSHTHSRMIGGVRFVWNVYKLWDMAKDLPIVSVEINSIKELDGDCWFGETKKPTVRHIAEHCKRIMESDLEHPIILDADGSLMDGGHRVAKALLLGHVAINAVRFRTQPPPERIESVVHPTGNPP